MDKNLFEKLKDDISSLRKTVERQQNLLRQFGYPEVKPQSSSDAGYWKAKYKDLMEEKIRIERERNKLYTGLEKIVNLIKSKNLDIDLSCVSKLKGPSGVSLLPGIDSETTPLNYEPFNNQF